VGLWLAALVPTYGMFALPRDAVAGVAASWWPLLVLLAIAWQVGMVFLITRLLDLQGTARGPGI
jgi:hypothetical protein